MFMFGDAILVDTAEGDSGISICWGTGSDLHEGRLVLCGTPTSCYRSWSRSFSLPLQRVACDATIAAM
jgi:hypothetical protein